MAKQVILATDTVKAAFEKCNDNYTELFEGLSPVDFTQFLIDNYSDNLVAIFPFNEESGTVSTEVLSGWNGSYTKIERNKIGAYKGVKAIESNAADSGVNFTYSYAFSEAINKSEGTFLLWFNPLQPFFDVVGEKTIFRIEIGTGYIQLNSSGADLILYHSLTTGTYLTKNYIKLKKWQLLSVSYSVADDTVILRRNSEELVRINGLTAFSGVINDVYSSVIRGCYGQASHFTILDKALTKAELQAMCLQTKAFILFEGDSRFSSYCIPDLAIGNITKKYIHANTSVAGAKVADVIARGAANDAMLRTGLNNIYVLLVGVNDGSAGSTAQQIYDSIQTLCQARKLAGWKVALCTEIDSDVPNWTAKYLLLNQLIAANHSFADYIIPLGADSRLQNSSDTDYFADGTHPTSGGALVYAEIISGVINSIT